MPESFKTLCFYCGLLLLAIPALSQDALTAAALPLPVTVTGYAPGAEGKRVRFTTSGDGLTNLEKVLTSAEVGANGRFSATFNLPRTTEVIFAIQFHTAGVYLEPGEKYDLRIAPMNYDDYSDKDPFLQSQNLTPELLHNPEEAVNSLIARFDSLYDSFLLDNFNALYRERKKNRVDSLHALLSREFPVRQNSYFDAYIRYKVASLEQLSQYHNPATLAKKYISNQPVLFWNREYMDFFNNYFTKYITVTSIPLHKIDFKPLLTGDQPVKNMLNALSSDTILDTGPLREMALLKGLLEFYNLPGYDRPAILEALKTLHEQSQFEGTREVAGNCILYLERLQPGSTAPEFSLTDRNGKELTLNDFKGKPLLLCFWTTWCTECLTEMDLLVPLYEKYKEQINFLSVSADKYLSKMVLFIDMKKEYTWNFANLGDRLETLLDYEIRSYPFFVLIDSEGRIFRYPAAAPGGDLEHQIVQLLHE